MSARVAASLAAGRRQGRPLIIPFVTAGFPTQAATVPVVRALAEAGADAVEVGLPFSDPLADGPTIQRASEVALGGGMTAALALEQIRELRQDGPAADLPILLMGYTNPLFAYGLERYLEDAAAAGVDGFIVADLPPEEAAEYRAGCVERGLAAVFLVAPNATDERIRRVDAASTHFSYCVSITGVTGARGAVQERTLEFLEHMRALAERPFVVGFGVKAAEHVLALGPHADGVVVGSAVIDAMTAATAAGEDPAAAAVELIGRLREAADTVARQRAVEEADG